MPQGFQVLNESGKVITDVTSRITRYLATANIPYHDFGVHTFTNDGFLTGDPFFLVDNQNNADSFVIAKTCLCSWVDISIVGNTATYQQKMAENVDISHYVGAKKDIVVHFGVY